MRNAVVVDSSIVVKWVLDEPDSNMAIALLTRWAERVCVASTCLANLGMVQMHLTVSHSSIVPGPLLTQ